MYKGKKVALVVDWLDAYGGAERIVKYLNEIYHFEEVYTLVNIMPKDKLNLMFDKGVDIKTSPLQVFGSHFRKFLILFPWALSKLKLSKDIDLVISVPHSVVKGFNSEGKDHVSYYVARNMKYIWEEKNLYFTGFKSVFNIALPYLRRNDIKMATNPSLTISISHFVKKWAIDRYNIDIPVIHSPVDISNFSLIEEKENYYVSVGRLEPYKRFDILIEAFNKIDRKLIIIGDGSQYKSLKNKASNNIEFKGFLESDEINKIIGKAKAFVFAGKEDFGIAPIEPQACGTPVIAYGAGGTLETVKEGETGVFFKEQTSESLIEAIHIFDSMSFDAKEIRRNAERFSIERFQKEFSEIVDKQKNKKTNKQNEQRNF